MPVLLGLILPALENKETLRDPTSRPRAGLEEALGPGPSHPPFSVLGSRELCRQPVALPHFVFPQEIGRHRSGREEMKPPSPITFTGT